jgi:hypothetical protein
MITRTVRLQATCVAPQAGERTYRYEKVLCETDHMSWFILQVWILIKLMNTQLKKEIFL